jgi:methylase of polypeptide subunit release factors
VTHALSELRHDLERARFTVDRLTELWGAEADAALFRGDRIAALRALDARTQGDPAATLAALFVLGVDVAVSALDEALPTFTAEGAAAHGLVSLGDGRAVPLLDLRPYSFRDERGDGLWWIASDLGESALDGALPADHVLGIGGASLTLSGLMIGTPARRVLDLGTGCGIQALHASRFADHVVATDISGRALRIAALNAELNGIETIEFRRGDLFAPVAGERFDRIVSNPPFVITPRTEGVPRYEYRDGGMVGDGLVATVIAGLGEHLEPGGIAQLLGNWEYRDGTDGLDAVASWCDAAGLDSWIVERERLDPPLYAETWIRDGGTRPGMPGYDALVERWLDDFERRGVTSVGFGYLTLRAPSSGPRFRRIERVATMGASEAGLGAHVSRTLGALDTLAGMSDDELLRSAPRVAPDVTERRHYWPGAEDPTVIELCQGGGFGRIVPADTALAALVGASDGELSVAAICAALAQLLAADEAALSAELLPQLRELISTGLLELPERA